jgi:hypothetical protein
MTLILTWIESLHQTRYGTYCPWVTGKADIWCAATSTAQLRRDRRSVSTTLPAGTGTIALSAPVLMRWGRYRHLR